MINFGKPTKQSAPKKVFPPLYENAEDFNKAMTEPPKPYSTDDFTPSAPLMSVDTTCDGADAIAYGLLHVKEKAPLLKESKPLIAMSEEAFEEAILFAYTKGKEEAEALDAEEITPAAAESLAMRIILNLKTGE